MSEHARTFSFLVEEQGVPATVIITARTVQGAIEKLRAKWTIGEIISIEPIPHLLDVIK